MRLAMIPTSGVAVKVYASQPDWAAPVHLYDAFTVRPWPTDTSYRAVLPVGGGTVEPLQVYEALTDAEREALARGGVRRWAEVAA